MRSCIKIYKNQIPVIEQALETAGLMLGTDKSRGYCLEMICTDFLVGASLDGGDPEVLLQSVMKGLQVPARPRPPGVLRTGQRKSFMKRVNPRRARIKLSPYAHKELRFQVLRRDAWQCQACGRRENLEVIIKSFGRTWNPTLRKI